MRILQTIPQNKLSDVGRAVKAAEENGYDMVVTMENRHDPFLALGLAAISSTSISIGTAVAIAFPRSPMVVANTCWDLQLASKGRFVLGLGPQIKPHNEKRFSVPWSAPVPRLREYIQALRAIWSSWEKGEKLFFEGDHYTFTLMPPNFVPPSDGHPPIPITIAAVGRHSLRLAGSCSDGVRLHPFCTHSYAKQVALKIIETELDERGLSRENFEVTGGGFLATGATDQEVASSIEWVRYRIAFYASTPSYWPVLEHHGYGDLGRKLNKMTKEGLWDKMSAEVSDDLVYLFSAVGRYDEIVAAIKTRFVGVADSIYGSTSIDKPSTLPSDLIQEIKEIPTEFKKYSGNW